jgi:serine/threonine-protein kinase
MSHPARIGKYELLEFLGGGMSHVYRARDTAIGRTVAVKILTPEGCGDADAKARFLAEVRMAGNIEHDNIIRIHDYGEEEGRPFIVMEFLVGEDLRSAIRNSHTGDLDNKLRIAADIARALAYVHTKKIIHRDIKPENIHIDASGKVKLMDFGIAKSEGLSLTKTGFSVGTPYYMAPEQIRGESPTERVDIYAFGILLFELLTGRKPVDSDSIERVFYAVLNEPLNPEPMLQAGLPKPVIDLVLRATAKKPEERPADFHEVIAALGALRADRATPAPTGTTRRLPIAIAAAIAVVVITVAAAIYLLLTRDSSPKPAASGAVATKQQSPELKPAIITSTGEMTLVPAGPFLSGEDKHSVTAPAFYVDITEVPWSAYAAFCKEKGRPLPAEYSPAKADEPATGITHVDAQEFAKWSGKRLPTAFEWEKAARGTDGRVYPWGDKPDPTLANVSDSPSPAGRAKPVNSFPDSPGPYRTLNMTGNVWEFIDELKTPSELAVKSFAALLRPAPTASEPWYMIRGGAFDRPLSDGVAYEWTSVPARFSAPNIGFRCVKNAE